MAIGQGTKERTWAQHKALSTNVFTPSSPHVRKALSKSAKPLLLSNAEAIASSSFLVGVSGVMNGMLVSGTELTQEISLRKALEAKPGDILRRFLWEAAVK